MTAQAVVNLLLSNVTTQMKVKTETGEDELAALNQIKDAVNRIDSTISTQVAALNSTIRSAVTALTRGGGGGAGAVNRNVVNAARNAAKGVPPGRSPLAGGGGKGGIVVPPGYRANPGGGRGSGGSHDVAASLNNAAKSLGLINVGLSVLVHTASRALADVGVGLSNIFSGVITDTMRWQVNMADLMFSLEGTNAALDSTKDKYKEIGDVTAQTGFARVAFQQQYIKELGKGLTLEMKDGKVQKRTQADLQRTLKTSMAAAFTLGADVSQTVEMFGEWNRHLGLTNNQLSSVGRAMTNIQHTTGLSGDNLLMAAKTANAIIKDVYRFSGISEKGIANIVKTTALGQKYGAEDAVKAIGDALAGGIESLSKADPKLAAAIFRAAGRSGISNADLQNGLLDDPEKTRKLYQGIIDQTSDYLKQQGLSGDVTQLTKELKQLQKFDPGKALRIKRVLKDSSVAAGLGAGGIEQLAKVQAELGKTPEDRIAELQRQKAGLTGPGAGFAGGKIDAEINKIQAGLRRDKFAEALEDINAGKMPADMAAFRQLTSDIVQDVSRRAKGANVDFGAELKARGLSEQDFKAGLAGPNSRVFAEVLQDIENTIAVKEKRTSDPILELQGVVIDANNKLKELAEFFLNGLGFKAMTAVVAALGAVSVVSGVGALSSGVGLLGGLVGGGEAAGAAGAVGAAGGSIAGTGGTILLVAAAAEVLLGAVGGLVGGFEAGAKAAEIFGVAEDDLTYRQQQAAEGAGVLTGALDWMTFGIFHKALGPTGDITKKLTMFFHEFYPLAAIFSTVTNSARIVWGTLKGLWEFTLEATSGLYDGIVESVTPMIDLGKEIWGIVRGPLADLLAVFLPANETLAKNVDIVGTITNAFKYLGHMLGDVFRWWGRTIGNFVKTVGPTVVTVFKGLASVMERMVPVVKNLWEGTKKYFMGLWDILAGIFTLDFRRIYVGLKEIWVQALPLFAKAWAGIISIAKDLWVKFWTEFVPWLGKQMKDGFFAFVNWVLTDLPGILGNALWAAMNAVFVDFPAWLFKRIKDGFDAVMEDLPTDWRKTFHDIGQFMYEQLTEGFKKLGQMILNIVPGLKTAVGAAGGLTETAENQAKAARENGPGVLHGLAGQAGGLRALGQGNLLEGARKFIGGENEVRGAVLNKVGGLLGAINPFDDGTQQVSRPGLGFLHAGEAVIPKDVWNVLRSSIAEGDPYSKGVAGLANLGAFAKGQAGEALDNRNPVVSTLQQILEAVKGEPSSGGSARRLMSAVGAGAFSNGAVGDAFHYSNMASESAMLFNKLFGGDGNETSNAISTMFGGSDLNSVWSRVASSVRGGSSRSSSSSLNYGDTTRSELTNSLAQAFSSVFMPKGNVSTSLFPADAAEEYISAQVEGSRPSGAGAVIPGVDALLNYLSGSHDDKLEQLVNIMQAMKDYMMKSDTSEVLFADSTHGVPSTEKSGVKNWAKGRITGQWMGDQDSAFQDQANNTGDGIT